MRHVGIGLVYLYRWTLGVFVGDRCKYHPSCSQYAIDAFRSYGLLRGLVLAAWRVARCNPWSHGGVDYAEDQTLFGDRTSSPRDGHVRGGAAPVSPPLPCRTRPRRA